MKTAFRRNSAAILRTDSGELECYGVISSEFAKSRKYFHAIVRRRRNEKWPEVLSFAALHKFFVRDHGGKVAKFPFDHLQYGIVAGLEDLDRARDKQRRFTHVYGIVSIAYGKPVTVLWRNKHVDTGD